MARMISEIARDIHKNWPKINYAAEPYLSAMGTMGSIDDNYGFDPGKSIVRYFLANATTWRGEDARRIKAELKSML